MSRLWKWIVPTIAAALSFGIAYASGPIGVYGVITKVVLEPNAENPERIQIWGVFSLVSTKGWSCATQESCDASKARISQPDAFQPPERGYLYFKSPFPPGEQASELKKRMLAEWNDLKSVAGKHQVVGFGDALAMPTVRKADERPENPENYEFGRDLSSGTAGVVKLRSDTDFPPIKALLAFR
jgi:hypothetical protein